MKILLRAQNHKMLIAVVLFFAIIYSLISFVNHYHFRTYALDLGMFNQAIYSFSHLKMNYFTLDITGAEINYFGDHFSPITILLSPFYYLFGSYTALIIQIIAILAGGIGIYKYTSQDRQEAFIPVLLVFQFFSIWGIYSALSFDFHTNVLAAMCVPWLLYFYKTHRTKGFLLCFALILLCKENMALWLIFILIGLVFQKFFTDKSVVIRNIVRFEIPLLIFCVIYFILILGVVMPSISKGEGTNQLARYSHLGGSLTEIVSSIIKQPKYIFSLFFESSSNEPFTFGIKSELHFMILISGGFALLYRPEYLIMLIPIYAQKLLTNDYTFWGLNNQYSIEFVPILTICFSDLLIKVKSKNLMYGLAIGITLLTAFYTYRTIEERRSVWYDKKNTAFYSGYHYETPLNISEINNALKKIPSDAVLSVSSSIAPHVAARDHLYHFPVIKNADYIILLSNSSTYPLSPDEQKQKSEELIKEGLYYVEYQTNDLMVLKKK